MPRLKPAAIALGAVVLLALPRSASAEPCRTQSFGGSSYVVCSFDLARETVRTYWLGGDGKPYRTFGALGEALEREGKSLRFAMNGGMYRPDLRPVGLYVESGKELAPANTKTVAGTPGQIPNFYKKPNGVFYIGDGEAGILETRRFLAKRPRADFATQSGPMLVIDGSIHPAFIAGSSDRKPRNGVCVTGGKRMDFVMTRGWVNFHAFARFFRDGLDCDNALFLDGGQASGLYAPELRRNDAPGHGGYGPIIAVVE